MVFDLLGVTLRRRSREEVKVKIVSEVAMKRQMMMTWESWENYTVVACGGRSDAVVPFCSERGPTDTLVHYTLQRRPGDQNRER